MGACCENARVAANLADLRDASDADGGPLGPAVEARRAHQDGDEVPERQRSPQRGDDPGALVRFVEDGGERPSWEEHHACDVRNRGDVRNGEEAVCLMAVNLAQKRLKEK